MSSIFLFWLLPVSLLTPQGAHATSENAITAATPHLVGYVSDLAGRGTYSLVVSCLLTLVLCVWSALHLNVPPARRGVLQTLASNTTWIMAGIYAPEMVVFTAWRQWCSAKLVQNAIHDALDETDSSSTYHRPDWTMTHGFFASAGGFALEIPSVCSGEVEAAVVKTANQLPARLTLTAKGVALLARCGYVPDVAIEDIRDKSKANGLAKATVVLQASWMLLQVGGRLCNQLPVTLLEVNTVAHVLCAFAMYVFWWNKPLLPKHPIVIRDDRLAALATYMYVCSEMSGHSSGAHLRSNTAIKTLLAHFKLCSQVSQIETLAFVERSDAENASCATNMSVPCRQSISGLSSVTMGGLAYNIEQATAGCRSFLRDVRQKETGTAFFERRPKVLLPQLDDMEEQGLNDRTLLMDAIVEHPFLLEAQKTMSHTLANGLKCWHIEPEELVVTHVRNWPGSDLLRDVDGVRVGIVLWAANLLYAGIHAAAWNEHFPSKAEQALWRVSVCYIGFCGGLWVVLNSVVLRYRRLNTFWEMWMDGRKGGLRSIIISFTVFICGLSLVVARIYLVLEAFISIRQLPLAAYKTARWSSLLPHF